MSGFSQYDQDPAALSALSTCRERDEGSSISPPTPATTDVRDRRFVVVIDSFALGGAERQAILLAREFRARGAHVEVWALFKPQQGPASELCEFAGVPWRALDLRWEDPRLDMARRLARLASILRRARPDIILPYTTAPNVLCGAVWRASGAAACVWNQRDDGLYRMAPELESWAARQTSWFVSNSPQGAAFLVATLGVSPRRISVVPNGVELAAPLESRDSWRGRLKIPSTAFVAGMLASLRHTKDHQTLLRAWQVATQLIRNEPRPVLLLAGRRDDTADLIDRTIAEMQLAESVRLLGPVSDVSGFLGACDLSVFSAFREGLPNAVLEAMLAGLPVLASDVPGVRDALGQGAAEHLVPPGDADGFARRIVALARDESSRASAGARNRERALGEYSVPAMVDAMAVASCRAVTPATAPGSLPA